MNTTDKANTELTFRKAGAARLRPGLPAFQRGDVTAFVESTVLAEYTKNMNNYNFDQLSSMLAVKNLIAACISYLIYFKPDSQDWPSVFNMIYSCVDENHEVPQDNPLDVLFLEASRKVEDCYCKKLFDSALTGGAYHIPSTFGKALRILADYIFC